MTMKVFLLLGLGLSCVESLPRRIQDTTTFLPPTTTPKGCFYNGRWYAPGTTIDEGYDPSSNWCYFTLCDGDGQILNGDDFNCKTTPPTTVPPTTIPKGCLYNGRWYAPGTTINNGYDPSSNWCYVTFCDSDGQILNGDNFNCKTTPPTTIPPTTIPPNPMVG